jgi:multiple sugar transport system substrate-binding protein
MSALLRPARSGPRRRRSPALAAAVGVLRPLLGQGSRHSTHARACARGSQPAGPPRSPLALRALPLALALMLAGCGDSFDEPAGGGSTDQKVDKLTVMIGSSGPAETKVYQDAAAAYQAKSGTTVEIIAAQDLVQQLGQGFAGGNPPDVFYVDPTKFQEYAKAGALHPYGDQVPDAADFFESLRQTYTYEDKLYCLPKDYGALALVINTDAWKQAGLTDADVPTTWDQLSTVAAKLTTAGKVGLGFTAEHARVGAFMVQSGGWLMNDDNTQVTADTPENLRALEYVKGNLAKGSFAYASTLGTGWGGEALGKGKAAMTIEGPWIVGALKADFPAVKWRATELPAGPAGKGTLSFSNCWGVAAKSRSTSQAVDLVKFLSSADQQKAAAAAFGPTPSRQSLKAWNDQRAPEQIAFAAGVDYAKGPVPLPGFESVMKDFTSQLETLKTGDPKAILSRLQRNGEAALK